MLGWIPIGSVPPESPIEGIEEDACLLVRESFLDRLSAARRDGAPLRPPGPAVPPRHRVDPLGREQGRGVAPRPPPGGLRHPAGGPPRRRRPRHGVPRHRRRQGRGAPSRRWRRCAGRRRCTRWRASSAAPATRSGSRSGSACRPGRPRTPSTSSPPAASPPTPGTRHGPALDGVLLDRLADVGACPRRGRTRAGRAGADRALQAPRGMARGRTGRRTTSAATWSPWTRPVPASTGGGRWVRPMPLEYVRISGAAGSPLARGSTFPPGVLTQFSELEEVAGRIDPRDKLSGNSLANFSAFLSRRFRANDWMWGRMDAAAGLVDILVRPEHLARETGGAAARGRPRRWKAGSRPRCWRRSPPCRDAAVRRSAELVFERLWADNRSLVHGDVNVALTDSGATLDATRQLLTARWQLEIFLAEVPDLLAAPLLPGASPEPFPTLDTPADDDLAAASGNIATVMSAYEDAPRRAADLWGSRKTTALGVRVARNLSRSLVPGSGVRGGDDPHAGLGADHDHHRRPPRPRRLPGGVQPAPQRGPRPPAGAGVAVPVGGAGTVDARVAAVLGRARAPALREGAVAGMGGPGRHPRRPGLRVDRPGVALAPGAVGPGPGAGDGAVGLLGGARQAAVRCRRRGPGHRPRLVPAADLGAEGLGRSAKRRSSVPSGDGG